MLIIFAIAIIIFASVIFVGSRMEKKAIMQEREALLKVVDNYRDDGWLSDREWYRDAIKRGTFDGISPEGLRDIMEYDEYENWCIR